MAKQIDDMEESDTDSSEDFTSDDNDINTGSEQTSEKIPYSNTCVLADFRLPCLHEVDATILPAVAHNYQQACKDLDKDVLPNRSINPCFSADFTPWWEVFTKSNHNRVVTNLATEPTAEGDTFDNWFNKDCITSSSWLCGPRPSTSGTLLSQSQPNQISQSQTSVVEDIKVPSIYDNKPAPKGRRALKRERKAEREKTLGKKWFGMKAPDVDTKLKNDMLLIQMRSVLDPKRFYKHRDRKGLPKYFQMGTVVDEGTDFYSSRLTKKQRKQTLVEELMADANIRQYNKRKYAELQQKMRTKKTGAAKNKHKKH